MLTESPTVSPLSLLDDEHKRKLHDKLTERIDSSRDHTYNGSSDDVISGWDCGHVEIINGPLGGGLSKRLLVPPDVIGGEDISSDGQDVAARMRKLVADYAYIINEIRKYTVDAERTRIGDDSFSPEMRKQYFLAWETLGKRLPNDTAWVETGMIGNTRAGRVIAKARQAWEKLDRDDQYQHGTLLLQRAEELNQLAAETIRSTAKQAERTYHVKVSADPIDLERLGHYKPCKDGHSCYARGGAYGLSPVIITQSEGSFVVLLEDDKGIYIGRAWGLWRPDGRAVVTNIYPNTNGGLRTAMAKVIPYAMREVFGLGRTVSGRIDSDLEACYLNGDEFGYRSEDTDCQSRICLSVDTTNAADEGGTYCVDCEDRFDSEYEGLYIDDHGDVCDSCSGDYVYIESHDRHCHVDDCCTDYRGEWQHRDDVTKLYDGEYAADDDPDLVELYDGDYAVQGHHDVIQTYTGEYAVQA